LGKSKKTASNRSVHPRIEELAMALNSRTRTRRTSDYAARRSRRRRPLTMAIAGLISAALTVQQANAALIERVELGRPEVAVFMLNGPIVGGETIALEREISKLPATTPVAVVLNSPGGNLQEGVLLGEFFYHAKIPTFVMGFGGICLSACSVAFLGGRDRITGKPSRFKMSTGVLGFHQFHVVRTEEMKKKTFKKVDVDNDIKKTRTITFLLISYLKDINEDMTKLYLMLKAPAEKMNLLSNEEAISLGIHVMPDDANDFIESGKIQERVKGP
jgi:hypothetical protein